MRLSMLVLVLAACSGGGGGGGGKDPFGPMPGVYPILRAEDLDVFACEDLEATPFMYSEDAKVVTRGDRDARVVDTWKMMSNGEMFVWDLDSSECTVTIPPVDAEPNWPTWSCTIGDGQGNYEVKDQDDKKHRMTASTSLRLDGAWVNEDHMELFSYESIVECISGDCNFWDEWIDSEDWVLPCENKYGFRGTLDPDL